MSLAVQGPPKFYAKALSSYKDAFVQRLQVGVSDSDSNTLCAVDGGIEESFANFLNDISRLDLTSFSTAARRKLFNALSGPSCLSFLVQVPHPAMDRYVVWFGTSCLLFLPEECPCSCTTKHCFISVHRSASCCPNSRT